VNKIKGTIIEFNF